MSSFGGVCDNGLSVNTHDKFYYEESTIRDKFPIVSYFYHPNNTLFYFLYCKSGSESSLCADESCNDEFKV